MAYPSQRMPVFAQNLVATSQPLAAQAGLRMLLKGGNAIDAAVAAAIALSVVEPTSNGIGSDAFALLWDGSRLHGINGSGRAPQAWSRERFGGLQKMPVVGWDAVTVPGAVDVWVRLSQRFGALDFEQLFAPAIAYAREGFLVSPITASHWQRSAERFRGFAGFEAAFLPGGRAPRAGELFRCPAQAQTLEDIARTQGASFYRGRLAEAMVTHARDHGGALCLDDLAAHQAEWVEPLSVPYGEQLALHELPPNGQGLVALIALGLLRRTDAASAPVDSALSLHLQIEAMKRAFALAHKYIADPALMKHPAEAFLEPARLDAWALSIDPERAADAAPTVPFEPGTVYLSAADARGRMVSFIQSNYWGFGSGIVVPHTGISLQNRAHGFSLDPQHPNCVAGGKRPYHTIIPGFVTQEGQPHLSFGVMGGPMQPQGHVQMMLRLFDYGQDPQTACDAPRWFLRDDGGVELEPGFSDATLRGLERRGHVLHKESPFGRFGGAQLIQKLPDGYCAASDHRKDGQAVGF